MLLLVTGGSEPLLGTVRTVFFDVGDTLLYIHPDVPTRYRELCAERGIAVSHDEIVIALKTAEHIYVRALQDARGFESSTRAADAFWLEYNGAVLQALKVDDTVAEHAASIRDRMWQPASWHPFVEVIDVLGALRAAGLQLALISNFTDTLVDVCRTHGLNAYVDCLIASTVVGTQKPDSSIFREALRRTGAVAEESVMVGDNYIADVLGARSVGMRGILVDRTRRGGRGMYDFIHRDGVDGTRGVRLDCPIVGDLRELAVLLLGG